MGSQDAAALEEIVVAGGLSQQRQINGGKREHRHNDGSALPLNFLVYCQRCFGLVE